MLNTPADKYQPYPTVSLPDRRWPEQTITRAPRWLSTDLRDGNQALAEPMDSARKLQFWDLLLGCGFKEIEVAFPSASQTDFNFVRQLIEENRIPDDVTIQVLTQAREDLIHRTFESLRGAKQAPSTCITPPPRCSAAWCSVWRKRRSSSWPPAPRGLSASFVKRTLKPAGSTSTPRKLSALPSRILRWRFVKPWRRSGSRAMNGQW